MAQLYTQQDRQPDTWVMSGAPAATTLYLSLETKVNYSDGSQDTLPANTLAVLPDSTTSFDRTSEVFVAYSVKGSRVLSIIKESTLPTLTSDYAPLCRVELHGIKPYQPEPYLASGALGTGGASTTTSVPSAAAAGRYFVLGTEPAGWHSLGFDDSAWAATFSDGRSMPYSGAHSETYTDGWDTRNWLYRRTFALPSGVVSAATLHCSADDLFLGIWINDTLVYVSPSSAASDFAHDPAPSVTPSVFHPGSSNVIAILVQNTVATTSVAYRLDVRSGGQEGDLLYFHDGMWVDLAIGTTGQGLTVVAGDPAWTDQPAPYTLPTASGSTLGGVKVGSGLSISAGVLSATGGGTVTSVALSAPGTFTVSGSPVTSSGTVSLSWASQTANTFLGAPNGSGGAPTFRALVGADIPVDASTIVASGGVITGNYQAGSGISISGNTISASGGGGSGTVTSVALTVPGFLSVSGSPITTSGTLAVTLANENATTVFAGPSSGSAAAPTFRALVAADLPAAASAGGHIHAHVHLG